MIIAAIQLECVFSDSGRSIISQDTQALLCQDPDEWSTWLSEVLKPEPSRTYITKESFETPGTDYVRPFHLCYRPEAGNKGHVVRENFRNLICLIMCNGFTTDPLLPGVEMLLVCKPDPRLCGALPTEPLQSEPDTLGPHQVHLIKGWTRVAALHTLFLVLRKEDCFNRWLDFLGSKVSTLRTIFVNKIALPDGKDQIDINRG